MTRCNRGRRHPDGRRAGSCRVALLALAVFLYAAITGAQESRPGRELAANGLVKLIEDVDIPAQEAGQLTQLVVVEGQTVKAGDLLARLDDDLQKLALARAQGELQVQTRKAESDVAIRAARKAAAVAQADLDRALAARRNFPESISDSEVDSLRLKAEKATLDIEQAEFELDLARVTRGIRQAELDQARLGVERRQIKAAFDGTIVELARRPGEWVQPGEKVLRMVRLDRLRIEVMVPPTTDRTGLVGAAIAFEPSVAGKSIEGRRLPGKIVFVHPEIDPVNGQIRVWAEVDNKEGWLLPGDRGLLRLGATAP
jgi:multidrug efflux pump subunit AcrA (membrane-fusion protein)